MPEITPIKYTGTGKITNEDYKTVKFVGQTKQGIDISITLFDAINLGDIDLTFAEKGDTVPSITFTACYNDKIPGTAEPWEIIIADNTQRAGSNEILLGAGAFYLAAAGDLYSSEQTYAVNDVVAYNRRIYKCITAISTPEEWTAAHWEEVEPKPVGATRGGGSFKVTREMRRINADGDRGAVKGRIVCEGSEATLTMNMLEFVTKIADIYPCIIES